MLWTGFKLNDLSFDQVGLCLLWLYLIPFHCYEFTSFYTFRGGNPYSYCGIHAHEVCCFVPRNAEPIGILPTPSRARCGKKGFDAGHEGEADMAEWPWHVSIYCTYIRTYTVRLPMVLGCLWWAHLIPFHLFRLPSWRSLKTCMFVDLLFWTSLGSWQQPIVWMTSEFCSCHTRQLMIEFNGPKTLNVVPISLPCIEHQEEAEEGNKFSKGSIMLTLTAWKHTCLLEKGRFRVHKLEFRWNTFLRDPKTAWSLYRCHKDLHWFGVWKLLSFLSNKKYFFTVLWD